MAPNRKTSSSRRKFIKNTSAAFVAAPLILPVNTIKARTQSPPSDKINLGLIGCGALGKANLNACMMNPDVVLVAACDVWKNRLDPVVEKFKKNLYWIYGFS
jgi:hypothetical protein